jgi:hypothetical protein
MVFGKNIQSSHIREGIYKYFDVYLKYIQVVKVTRDKISHLDKIEHTNNAGVYILSGINEFGQIVVYVGKGGDVLDRIKAHKVDKKKSFFSEVFLITTTDKSFGDSHISYLENFLYNRLRLSSNIITNNKVVPTKSNLPAYEEEQYKNFGDSIVSIVTQASSGNILITRYGKPEDRVFKFKNETCDLIGTHDEGRFIIHKDSKVSKYVSDDAPMYVKNTRSELISNGTFIEFEDSLILSKDWYHDEIKRTINILLGKSSSNSLKSWKNESGLTLKEYIDNGND